MPKVHGASFMQGQIIEHVRRVMKLQWEEGDVDRLARAFDVSQGPGFRN